VDIRLKVFEWYSYPRHFNSTIGLALQWRQACSCLHIVKFSFLEILFSLNYIERPLPLVIHGEPSRITFCDTKLLLLTERSTQEEVTFSHTWRALPVTSYYTKLLLSTERSTQEQATLCRGK
jgi:hypothetical protein